MPNPVQSSADLVSEFLALQKERHEHPERYRGWKTGVADLDKITGGLQRGWYFVVAGKRKSGKTAFMTTLTRALGDQGVRFLRISLEESNMQIAERMFSNIGGIDRSIYRDILLSDDTWQLTYQAGEVIKKFQGGWNYAIDTVEAIQAQIALWKPDVVLVDYIQLMRMPGAESRTTEVGLISRGLKALTLGEQKVAVVAAAQLNDMGEYLWSRDIGRDADVAIKLTKPQDSYGHAVESRLKLEIADSRHSQQADFEILFNGARSLVGSLAPPVNIDNLCRN